MGTHSLYKTPSGNTARAKMLGIHPAHSASTSLLRLGMLFSVNVAASTRNNIVGAKAQNGAGKAPRAKPRDFTISSRAARIWDSDLVGTKAWKRICSISFRRVNNDANVISPFNFIKYFGSLNEWSHF